MKILHGPALITELRARADNIKERLWIAVPYIGSLTSVRKLLGKSWFNTPTVSVRVITDIEDLEALDPETMAVFYQRGTVRSLRGLHAKLYILDGKCILTYANLTATAFSKRHEIGILLEGTPLADSLKVFEKWWAAGSDLQSEELHNITKKNNKGTYEEDNGLLTQWQLPKDPGSFTMPTRKFLDYERPLDHFTKFGMEYAKIGSIWPWHPLNLEIDGLFNYLYHHAIGYPSQIYAQKHTRALTSQERRIEMKKWIKEYIFFLVRRAIPLFMIEY